MGERGRTASASSTAVRPQWDRSGIVDDAGVTGLPPAPPPASNPPNRWPWLLALVPLGVGVFLGYQAAYEASLGGFGGALGAAFLAYAIGGLVLIAVLVGAANLLRPAGRGRTASRYAFAAAGLIALGGAGGAAGVQVLDLGYHPPVVLGARGDASIVLDGVAGFEPRASGRADCWSVADGTEVEEVVALSLGELNGNLLRGDLFLPVAGVSGASVSFFVDAAHLPEGSVVPMWNTQDVEIDSAGGGAIGTLRFDGVPIHVDPEVGAPAASWPATLSGEISWACEPWVDAEATPPPTVATRITLDLSGVEWSASPGINGSCEFEIDGSVANVVGDGIGSLQGEPMTLGLGLLGDPRAGDEATLMLSVSIAAPSPGSLLPLAALVAATSGRSISWVDLVTIEEIADGGRSGRLTFSDLPNQGTPVAGWPATLSGELSWECG